jgi:flagellar assembly factor FliW
VAGELPDLVFVRPMPGFPQLTRFVLVRLEENGTGDGGAEALLYELRSLEQPQVRFLVVVPTPFFPDYEIELDETACADLHLHDADDTLVLVVLTVDPDSGGVTANLLAPVVVNARTRDAAQVILSGSDWPVRAAVA